MRTVFAKSLLVAILGLGCERRPRSENPGAKVDVLPQSAASAATEQAPVGTRVMLPDDFWNLAGYWQYDCLKEGWRGPRCSALSIEVSDTWTDSSEYYVSLDQASGPKLWGIYADAVDARLQVLSPPFGLDLMQPSSRSGARLVAGLGTLGDGPTEVDAPRWRSQDVTVLPTDALRTAHDAAGATFGDVLTASIREVIGADRRSWLVTLRLRSDGRPRRYEVDTRTGAARSVP